MNLPFIDYTSDTYLVKIPLYSGPLDLLLDLIERAELDISKLALAQVTDQYLEYLSNMENRDPDEISAFVVIAARLVQIKSASLLPRPGIFLHPTDLEEDPGEALAQQLIIYKRFKEISYILKERDEMGLRTYLRVTSPPPIIISKFDLSDITLEDIISAARNVFQEKAHLPSLSEVVTMPRITIRQKIKMILQTIHEKGSGTSFSNILQTQTRVEMVVSFLAILELIKRQVIEAQQSIRFGDIQLLSIGEWDDADEMEFEFGE